MKSFIIIVITFFGLNSFSQPQMVSGDSAYAQKDYELAIQNYSQLLSENYNSVKLFYNLGNAYYKNNEIGKSIWAYQKAKKINPGHSDINFNLNFVSQLTKDKIEQNKGGISQWFSTLIYGNSINLWAILALLFSLLIALFFYWFKSATQKSTRALHLLFCGTSGLFMILCLAAGIAQKNHLTNVNNGIIVNPVVKVYTAPNSEENTSFELHEGAKFNILKTEGNWINISLNKNSGWVEKEDVLLY